MDTAPTVSVLIATFNKSDALRYTIESVLWQTFRDFELWVIGDACTDNSAELVASFAARDARVHWHNLPQNTGYQSAPHNEGLRRSRGRYIAYVNHDDIWLPNHLELLVGAAEQSGADFVYSILTWLLPDRNGYADIPAYPDAPLPPEASVTLHRSDIVQALGFWKPPDETYAVPRADYFRRAQFAGKRFVLVPRLTVLKLGRWPVSYAAAGPQPEYMEHIRNDPSFAEKQVTKLLARRQQELEQLPSWRRLKQQLLHVLRRWLMRRGIDPARLVFWHKPGRHIRAWRRAHGLDRPADGIRTEKRP
jgi:glycosyltransferase involved in cell wall biosynthesis